MQDCCANEENVKCRVCLEDTADSDGIVILNSDQIQKLIYIGDSSEIIATDEYPVCLCCQCAEVLDWIHEFISKLNASKVKFRQFVMKREASTNATHPFRMIDMNLQTKDFEDATDDTKDAEHSIDIVKMEISTPPHDSFADDYEFQPTEFCSVQLVSNCKIEPSVECKPKPKIGPKSIMKKTMEKSKFKSTKAKSKHRLHPTSTTLNMTADRVPIKSEFGPKPIKTIMLPQSQSMTKAKLLPTNVAPDVIRVKSEFQLTNSQAVMEANIQSTNEELYWSGLHTPSTTDNACHLCSKEFSTRANMLRHVREHLGRRFVCQYANCTAFFTQKSSLQVHMARHEGHKPFECDICGKKFSQSKSLVFHIRVHTGESPFECDYCQKTFKQKSNLVRHFKSHQKSRPFRQKRFQCPLCSKFLASKQSLIRHTVRHENETRRHEIETRQEAELIEKNIFL